MSALWIVISLAAGFAVLFALALIVAVRPHARRRRADSARPSDRAEM